MIRSRLTGHPPDSRRGLRRCPSVCETGPLESICCQTATSTEMDASTPHQILNTASEADFAGFHAHLHGRFHVDPFPRFTVLFRPCSVSGRAPSGQFDATGHAAAPLGQDPSTFGRIARTPRIAVPARSSLPCMFLVASLALTTGPSHLAAQSPVPSISLPTNPTAPASSDPTLNPASRLERFLPPQGSPERPALLVLKSGQVITGAMEPQLGGYMVVVPNGRMLIPYDQVRTAASSLTDAYQRICSNRHDPSANERIDLAQWCANNGLLNEARDELLAALRLDPNRPEARHLLQRVEQARRARAADPLADQPLDVRAPAPPPVTASGLSGAPVAEFVLQVQPLLMNCCGNANCHGTAATNAFQLQPAPSGPRQNRLANDANLAAILNYLNLQRPDESPLLTIPAAGEGPHRSAFQGPRAREQLELVRRWVHSVAAEAPRASTAAHNTRRAPEKLIPAAAWQTGAAGSESGVVPAGGVAEPAPTTTPRRNHVDQAFLQRMLDDSRPDPFDPDEFNRLIHGVEAAQRRDPAMQSQPPAAPR